ncbi:MAG: phosphodiesterase [Bacilli bacterium]|jgi:putative phosphoesterase|nr:phosphodiesterase [Bacilli bacterium]
MNILIGSDIHGSYKYAKLLLAKVEKYDAKKILLLGDFYYNGARNVPPEEYSPKDVVSLLNDYASKIIAVKGNCESEVDQWVSKFPISDMATLFILNKEIIMTHGHHYSFEELPPNPGDIFLQGHTHIGVLEKKGDLILANPGSVSLPKDGHHSYMVMNEEGIKLLDLLTDEVYKEIKF